MSTRATSGAATCSQIRTVMAGVTVLLRQVVGIAPRLKKERAEHRKRAVDVRVCVARLTTVLYDEATTQDTVRDGHVVAIHEGA
jgi:hypothetical protein